MNHLASFLVAFLAGLFLLVIGIFFLQPFQQELQDNKQQIAKEVTVFMWIDVYGDGKVTVPLEYDTEFEYRLPDGTKRKLNRHGGLTAGTTRSESTEIK